MDKCLFDYSGVVPEAFLDCNTVQQQMQWLYNETIKQNKVIQDLDERITKLEQKVLTSHNI